MPDFSLIGGGAESIQEGFDYSNTRGTAVTSGSANTKGSYAELVSAASNNYSGEWVHVVITTVSGTDASYLVDVSLGGAGSESVIIPDLFVWAATQANVEHPYVFSFPIRISSGVRISARCQSSSATQTCYVHIHRTKTPFSMGPGLSVVDAIGVTSASSRGTTVARSTANTFGSWVEMSASLANTLQCFVVSAIRASTIGSWANARVTYDIGVGSAGNEEVIHSGAMISQMSTETTVNAVSCLIPVGIPAGARVAIRAQSTVADTDLDLDYVIYGVR